MAETKTKKKEFLNRIDRIVPWNEWLKIRLPAQLEEEFKIKNRSNQIKT